MKEISYPSLIKQLRQQRGLTQEGLAREIGVTYATVNGWENGRRTPMPFLAQRLIELAEQAGIDSDAHRVDGQGGET